MFQRISKFHLWVARAFGWIGVGCFIVGIVGGAMNSVPGLEPTHWLIMAAAAWVFGILNVLLGLEESIKE